MRSTVTIEKTMLDELLTETRATSKASAVKVAISDYLRRRRKDKIKSMKGKLEFDLTAEELRLFRAKGRKMNSQADTFELREIGDEYYFDGKMCL